MSQGAGGLFALFALEQQPGLWHRGRAALSSWLPDIPFFFSSLSLFFFFSLFKQHGDGGCKFCRLGAAELKFQLASWLAPAFCGAQRCVMPACCVQFDKPRCWDRAGYSTAAA